MKMMPISELQEWPENPRIVSPEDMERLKHQLTRLGQYKPLLVTTGGMVMGGNSRLRAMRELGWSEVLVEEVKTEGANEEIELALMDNDRAGFYEAEALAELLHVKQDFPIEDYRVEMGNMISGERLAEIMGNKQELERGKDEQRLEADLEVFEKGDQRQLVLYLTKGEKDLLMLAWERATDACGDGEWASVLTEMISTYDSNRTQAG